MKLALVGREAPCVTTSDGAAPRSAIICNS